MKSFASILMTVAIAGTIVSCNDDKTETSTTDTNTDTSSMVTTPPAIGGTDNTSTTTITVPENTRMAFEKKYTGATNVRWVRENRDEARTVSQDSMDYEVTYRWNDMDYTTWYDWNGDWLVTTAKVSNDKLPAAINEAINSRYAGYTITEIDMENDKNMTTYEVDLEKAGEKKTIHFSPEGREIKKKEKMK